ncbi:thioredoxin [Prevotella sp. S7 MS 2]|uniref:thioredoxin n=1 Tax=Prevotella sp. S7 MS 2 TaxID=1287488 RepID=UPI0005132F1D|nr:thioredoxin [Prevotella sp. S7 MS 2]KGI59808.1 thioredoxin [Prevotella sp. S7 MS 2]
MKTKIVLIIMAVAFTFVGCNTSPRSVKNVAQQVESKENSEKAVQSLTAQEFKNKVMDYENDKQWKFKGDKPAIIDFYATWCGPCKMMSPILEQLATKYKGRINVYQIDIDKEQELATQFGIQSIPTFLMIPKTGQPQMIVGVHHQAEFDQIIMNVLLK